MNTIYYLRGKGKEPSPASMLLVVDSEQAGLEEIKLAYVGYDVRVIAEIPEIDFVLVGKRK
jgi:hypothetical protein